jgi:BirA family transcriptional regulator, biotin operon repressor / biotin---[acetyl-CoA-carboxylase] ligase
MRRLDAEALQEACVEEALPWRVQVLDEVGSTSDAVRDAALAGAAPGLVLFAESQTAGRGRRENRWTSSKGKDFMFSVLLRPAAPAVLWPRLTTLAALALARAVEMELPLKPQIKWPNDLYLNDRKICGLLAEAVTVNGQLALVLGVGMNVNNREFPYELTGVATSLLLELNAPSVSALDRQSLALTILKQLHKQFQRMDHGFHEVIAEVRARSWLLGRQIRATVDGREVFGRALDLNAEGHLVIVLPDGSLTTLSSAEGVRQVI